MARESYAIQASFRTGEIVNAVSTHHVCDTAADLPSGTDVVNGDTAVLLDSGGFRTRSGGAWNTVGGGGAATATTVEVNLGTTATWRGRFTITDAEITATKKVLCWQAPGPYTGKGTLADEAEMQPVSVVAVTPASGSATVTWETPPVVGWRPAVGMGLVVPGAKDAAAMGGGRMSRLGKVRGNVKFTYAVFA
jgi:hypothetical protein